MTTPRYGFGFDIGGTFTDFVLVDHQTGDVQSFKTPTTPHAPGEAVMEGWRTLLERVGASGADVATAIHGTTLITNAFIERKGAVTLLLTTKGFADLLDTQREMRYDIYDLHGQPVEHLVPRFLRFEVGERIDTFGDVVVDLAEADLEAMAAELRDAGIAADVEAIAVCFLNAFASGTHEEQTCDWIQQHLPGVAVSISSEVAPQIREYERMSTTVANAYVQPLTERYLQRIDADLKAEGLRGDLYLMLSSGGITTLDTAGRFPVRLVESGPAAGALVAVFYGKLTGHDDLVSFDMGGTTAKMCLIRGGEPSMADTFEIARVRRFKRGSGLPVRIPTIELIEIGAGGGSIARVDELGLLKVGPDSAGAEPGPACYGLGGTHPTVTDADAVLGYLNPEFFLGGRMALDLEAAKEAIRTHIAEPMGLGVTAAAHGIYRVVNENMVSATRVHVAEQGADPRRLRLVAFGGAGPVHAHEIAKALKMRGYLCPASAGVASALGFLTAPTAFQFARTHYARVVDGALAELEEAYRSLEREGAQTLTNAAVAEADMRYVRQADMRHAGQGHQIVVTLPDGDLTTMDVGALRARFFETYASIYGHVHEHLDLEVTTCRVSASGPAPTIELKQLPPVGEAVPATADDAVKGTRAAFFADAGGFVDTPLYDRTKLRAGTVFHGPAIVEDLDSTAVIGPNTRVEIDPNANLIATLLDD
jgi:N-methylhydantoinase A